MRDLSNAPLTNPALLFLAAVSTASAQALATAKSELRAAGLEPEAITALPQYTTLRAALAARTQCLEEAYAAVAATRLVYERQGAAWAGTTDDAPPTAAEIEAWELAGAHALAEAARAHRQAWLLYLEALALSVGFVPGADGDAGPRLLASGAVVLRAALFDAIDREQVLTSYRDAVELWSEADAVARTSGAGDDDEQRLDRTLDYSAPGPG